MFIVWRRQSLAYNYQPGTDKKLGRGSLSAQLSRSERVDGKPKRVVICGLGHIEEARIACLADRAAFWYRAGSALHKHAPGQFDELKAKLLERIPDVDADEMATGLEATYLDLIVLDADAAMYWCRRIRDDQMRSQMFGRAKYVAEQRAAHAKFERWWRRQVWAFDDRRRDQLTEYAANHDIELKPFDYSLLDPETRAAVISSTARLKELT
jgi:hypothetical protein